MDSAIFCPSLFVAARVPFNGFALGANLQFRHINAVSHEIFPHGFTSGDREKLIVYLGPAFIARGLQTQSKGGIRRQLLHVLVESFLSVRREAVIVVFEEYIVQAPRKGLAIRIGHGRRRRRRWRN